MRLVENRARCAKVLTAVLQDLPRQQQDRLRSDHDVLLMRREAERARDERRVQKRAKREEAQRRALLAVEANANDAGGAGGAGFVARAAAAAAAAAATGPMVTRGVGRGNDASLFLALRETDLVTLQALWRAQRAAVDGCWIDQRARKEGENSEDLCVVCNEGHSEPPDQILFCERCDLAIHQKCYGVPEVRTDGRTDGRERMKTLTLTLTLLPHQIFILIRSCTTMTNVHPRTPDA